MKKKGVKHIDYVKREKNYEKKQMKKEEVSKSFNLVVKMNKCLEELLKEQEEFYQHYIFTERLKKIQSNYNG
tara:strand:- start:172 stop:387 length:216 start_codon:yes stop_codon:yes gene_type:complete